MGSHSLMFVDDEPDLLAFYRQVFARDYDVATFSGGREALSHLQENPGYAAIVSDFSMPGMDGIEFLSLAADAAPQAVRIMLTGYASEETAINAVNRGDIFKFLRKPTRIAEFSAAVRAAVQRHELETAERDLLEKTLRGSIEMLTEALSLANPLIFGRSSQLKEDMADLAQRMRVDFSWELEAAAMLCELGLLTQPDSVIQKIVRHEPMTALEERESHAQAGIGANLVRKVPRLEPVADCILYQYRNYDGTGYPEDASLAGDDIPVGARMLRVLKDLRGSVEVGRDRADVIEEMRHQARRYDHHIVSALKAAGDAQPISQTVTISVFSLQNGAILADDVFGRSGSLIMREGQEISPYLAEKLHHFADAGEIPRDIRIYARRTRPVAASAGDDPTSASQTNAPEEPHG